jgi:hypothetical protein
MTKIDTDAEIDIVWERQQATVRMPLAGEVSQEWCRRYQALARRRNFPASAELHPGRGWVIVELPEGAGPPEVTATLDTARDLVTEADGAGDSPDTGETDRLVRTWWSGQRG